jgi:Zn finger protein HypA/HybF involved in hydrogenase expression
MEWLKNNPLVVITDPDYWDCNCYEKYIHKKSVTLSCPICKMTEDECSDSRPDEIKLFYKDYKRQS